VGGVASALNLSGYAAKFFNAIHLHKHLSGSFFEIDVPLNAYL